MLAAAGGLGMGALSGCGDELPYDPATAPRKWRGYYSLAETPYFELRNGRLVNVVKNFPPAIDFHAHLAFTVGTPVKIDMTAEHEAVKYLMDCDNTPGCELDLDVYLNYLADDEMLKNVDVSIFQGALTGKGPGVTHTIPNLIRELDEMQFDKAVLLPIRVKLGDVFPARDMNDMEERWTADIAKVGAGDRFEMYSSVHMEHESWLDDLEAAAARGAKGIKFHPTMQSTAPNSDAAMTLFQECERLGLDVFFHAGRAGIEPEGTREFANMSNYVAPLEEFKNIQFIFGHAGARDWEEAFVLAKQHPHVWMELAGPSIPWMETMVEEFDKERILFGSDWPFYPVAASLIKVFHVAHGDDTLRDMLLSDNARRLLRL